MIHTRNYWPKVTKTTAPEPEIPSFASRWVEHGRFGSPLTAGHLHHPPVGEKRFAAPLQLWELRHGEAK